MAPNVLLIFVIGVRDVVYCCKYISNMLLIFIGIYQACCLAISGTPADERRSVNTPLQRFAGLEETVVMMEGTAASNEETSRCV